MAALIAGFSAGDLTEKGDAPDNSSLSGAHSFLVFRKEIYLRFKRGIQLSSRLIA